MGISENEHVSHGKAEKPEREILCLSYIVRHTMHGTVSVSIKQPLRLKSLAFFALSVPVLFSQTKTPEWCRALPRPSGNVDVSFMEKRKKRSVKFCVCRI